MPAVFEGQQGDHSSHSEVSKDFEQKTEGFYFSFDVITVSQLRMYYTMLMPVYFWLNLGKL